jgi:polysaccharide export outer membrane protein
MARLSDFRAGATRLVIAALIAGSALPLAACGDSGTIPPAADAGAADGLASYRLGPGDRVRITVFGQQDLTGEYAVDGQGNLAFPLINEVKAGGMTGNQLAQAIENKLSPDYLQNPNVSVEVIGYRPFYIVGEVQKPGSYPYVNGMAVINAVALAGGFTYRAREDDFYIRRAGGSSKMQRVDADPATPVYPGDVITVRERYF